MDADAKQLLQVGVYLICAVPTVDTSLQPTNPVQPFAGVAEQAEGHSSDQGAAVPGSRAHPGRM